MKRYDVRKIVEAKSIKDAIKKEKDIQVEYIVMIDEDDEDSDDFENGKIYGFRGK